MVPRGWILQFKQKYIDNKINKTVQEAEKLIYLININVSQNYKIQNERAEKKFLEK